MHHTSVIAKSVDEAWQLAIARVLRDGESIKTEYDKPNDPPSKDATAIIEITEPFKHPFLVRGKERKIKSNLGNEWTIYGCDADTYLLGSVQSNYIEEVMDGVNDRFLRESEKSFPYSYHDRIWNYAPYSLEDVEFAHHDLAPRLSGDVRSHKKVKIDEYGRMEENGVFRASEALWLYRKTEYAKLGRDCDFVFPLPIASIGNRASFPIEFVSFPTINQLDPIVEKLKKDPYSRRCQFTTWRPYSDPFRPDPPCLQRGWFRVVNGKLVFETSWRSRDLFRAWEANVNGMLYLQKEMARRIGCEVGTYLDFNNSLHIYGSTFKELLDIMIRLKERKIVLPELEEQIEPLQNLIKNKK